MAFKKLITEDYWLSGLEVDLPIAGKEGRVYYTTDTLVQYRDNGTSWDLVGSSGTIGSDDVTDESAANDGAGYGTVSTAITVLDAQTQAAIGHAVRDDNPHSTTAAQVGAAALGHRHNYGELEDIPTFTLLGRTESGSGEASPQTPNQIRQMIEAPTVYRAAANPQTVNTKAGDLWIDTSTDLFGQLNVWINEPGDPVGEGTLYIDTTPDTDAPWIVEGPEFAAESSVDISWSTDESTTGYVEYGEADAPYVDENSYVSTVNSVYSGTTHTVKLTGLIPGATYQYRIVVTDGSGNTAATDNDSVTTPAS